MSGLNDTDMRVLRSYVEQGNRERYWNYLAQHEGADGYGLLALGVVRNDSVPGAVANAFAQSHARDSGVVMSERGWEMFGRHLIERDFELRSRHFRSGDRAAALNLPGVDVQDAHRAAFSIDKIDADAWTPNRLFDAARRVGGEQEVDKVWHTMLDNSLHGTKRMADTTRNIVVDYREQLPGWSGYVGSLALAEAAALRSTPNTDPDHIDRGIDHYEFNHRDKSWSVYSNSDVAEFGFRTPLEPVRDPALIESLNDARAVRLERAAKSEQVHPDDPNREIAKSPHTIADATDHLPSGRLAASGREIDPALYEDLRQRLPAGTSEDRLSQITFAARQADIRGGEVAGLSIHGDTTLQVMGTRPGDQAVIDLSSPPPTVEQTMQQAQAHEHTQVAQLNQFHAEQAQVEQVAQQQQQQQTEAMTRSGPSMGGPRMG